MTQQLDMFGAPARTVPARTPAQQRDEVLAALATKRAEAVRLGIETARALCRTYPDGITAADVQRAMQERHAAVVAGLDPRWLGAVLLPSTGFVRTGELRRTGSRCRPQPAWRVAT